MNKLKIFSSAILLSTLFVFLSCSHKDKFVKDCDLCDQISQKEVKTSMINFVYNDIIANISEEAEILLREEKEILLNGHKFIECGCIDSLVIYHLWCANDETYQLEVEVLGNNEFLIVGIGEAEFSHP